MMKTDSFVLIQKVLIYKNNPILALRVKGYESSAKRTYAWSFTPSIFAIRKKLPNALCLLVSNRFETNNKFKHATFTSNNQQTLYNY